MNLQAVITEPQRPIAPSATEYLKLAVSPVLSHGVSLEDFPDLTGAPVAVAWRDVEQAQDMASPQSHEWVWAAWEDTGPGVGTITILTGQRGAIRPGAGRHYLWARIICPPEVTVIRAAGFLTVK